MTERDLSPGDIAQEQPSSFVMIETLLIEDGARTECIPTADPYRPRWLLYRGDGSIAADTANGDLIGSVKDDHGCMSLTIGYAVKRRREQPS